MSTLDRAALLQAFDGKILGVRNYRHAKGEFTVEDFLRMDSLLEFLEEVFTCESDITPAGKVFLEKYYGFEALAPNVSAGCGDNDTRSDPAHALEWLRELEPMETSRFIEEARGNIQPGAGLRSDLLPPDFGSD